MLKYSCQGNSYFDKYFQEQHTKISSEQGFQREVEIRSYRKESLLVSNLKRMNQRRITAVKNRGRDWKEITNLSWGKEGKSLKEFH